MGDELIRAGQRQDPVLVKDLPERFGFLEVRTAFEMGRLEKRLPFDGAGARTARDFVNAVKSQADDTSIDRVIEALGGDLPYGVGVVYEVLGKGKDGLYHVHLVLVGAPEYLQAATVSATTFPDASGVHTKIVDHARYVVHADVIRGDLHAAISGADQVKTGLIEVLGGEESKGFTFIDGPRNYNNPGESGPGMGSVQFDIMVNRPLLDVLNFRRYVVTQRHLKEESLVFHKA